MSEAADGPASEPIRRPARDVLLGGRRLKRQRRRAWLVRALDEAAIDSAGGWSGSGC